MCCEDHLAQEVGIQIAGGNRCRQSGFRHFGYEALSGEVASACKSGEACSLQLQPAFFPYNTLLELSCGGQRIYGFESFGQLTCEVSERRVTTCLDDGDIAHGGDPRVRLDRSVGRMTVDDGANWRIELAFTE